MMRNVFLKKSLLKKIHKVKIREKKSYSEDLRHFGLSRRMSLLGGRHDVNDLKEINEKLRNTINNNSYKSFKYM